MRILHVVHHYPPELHGGTQSYVASLARRQSEQGAEVCVVAGAQAGSEKSVEEGLDTRESDEGGVRVVRVHRRLPEESLAGQLGSERIGAWFAEFAADFRPDVAHVHHWSTLTDDVVRRIAGAGVPVVVTLHDLYTSCARYFRMPDARSFCDAEVRFDDCARCLQADVGGMDLGQLEGIIRGRFESFQAELQAAARVLALSQAQIDLLTELPGFDFDQFELCPIGIPEDAMAVSDPAATPAWKPIEGRLRIANWAGLDPRKGIHLLLDAVRSSDDRDAFEVHLFGRDGEPAYMEELHALAEGCNVTFHGGFRDEERASFGAVADVAVFPFLAFETHGIVVDEALQLGMAVIVPDHGAPRERITGRGFAVAAGDVAGLRSTLEWLLDLPDEVERMRTAPARLTTLEAHAARVGEIYAELQADQ